MERINKNIKRLLLLTLIILVSAGVYFYWQTVGAKKEVHFHAGFQVYENDKLLDFSDLKYMQVVPCTADGAEIHMDEQIEKAHLHDNIGDVVHVHREGAVWSDLFKNIKYNIDPRNINIAYKNGKVEQNILKSPIQPYDSIIISVGKNKLTGSQLKKAVTKDRILEAEKRSETCGS